MRAIIAFFLVIGISIYGVYGCTSRANTPQERVIKAEPHAIVAAMNRALVQEGAQVVARSDSGDYYRQVLTEKEIGSNPAFKKLSTDGTLTLDAHVTAERIKFSSVLRGGLVAGFAIDMSPAPEGSGTLAKITPIFEENGAAPDKSWMEALQRSWSGFGAAMLETVAAAAEARAAAA